MVSCKCSISFWTDFRYVLGELIYALKVMHEATGSAEVLTLPTVPDGSPWQHGALDYCPVLAEAVVVYLSSALVELANAKSSVIGVRKSFAEGHS